MFEDYKITAITEERFEEIVKELMEQMPESFVKEIKTLDVSKLIGLYHMTLGRHIRNTYGLWSLPNHTPVLIDGVDHSPDHPDAISGSIIRELYKRVSETL